VTAAIQLLPDKQYASDPIPTRLLKDCADVVAPFLVELYNKSLQTGSVPASFKAAYITAVKEIGFRFGRRAQLLADI